MPNFHKSINCLNEDIKVLNKRGLNGKKIVHFIERDLKKLEK